MIRQATLSQVSTLLGNVSIKFVLVRLNFSSSSGSTITMCRGRMVTRMTLFQKT